MVQQVLSRVLKFSIIWTSIVLLACANRVVRAQTLDEIVEDLDNNERVQAAERLFETGARDDALEAWRAIDPRLILTEKEAQTYLFLEKELFSRSFDPPEYDITKLHVSVMTLDHEDLWLGTWEGGVFRYSLGTGEITVFREERRSITPIMIYNIRVDRRYVTICSYTGITRYDKRESEWIEYAPFAASSASTDILYLNKEIYIATLGTGLWKQDVAGYGARIGQQQIGDNVTTLDFVDSIGLLIGTPEEGVFVYRDGEIINLQILVPEFSAKSITQIRHSANNIWIASSGDGLFRWNYRTGIVRNYNRSTGHFNDDWITSIYPSTNLVFVANMGGDIIAFDNNVPSNWYTWNAGNGARNANIGGLAFLDGRLYYSGIENGITEIDWESYFVKFE